MGVPPTGSVAIAVAQRSVLQNPGGATGNLGGAATQRRGLSRTEFRKEIARQVQGTTPTTNQPNPVAAQLLLAPTFVPIQAEAVLDQANMRIAIPVSQIDGEFILTMQVMNGGATAAQPAPAGGAQPAQGQTPTTPEPAAQSSLTPSAESPATSPNTTEGEKPAAAQGEKPTLQAQTNGTETARPERRQDNKDKYGDIKPPQGAVIVTMKQIDTMAEMDNWGGQVAITKMMNEYVKAKTGKDVDPIKGASDDASAKLVVA
jgi:hypothetical protein